MGLRWVEQGLDESNLLFARQADGFMRFNNSGRGLLGTGSDKLTQGVSLWPWWES